MLESTIHSAGRTAMSTTQAKRTERDGPLPEPPYVPYAKPVLPEPKYVPHAKPVLPEPQYEPYKDI